MDKKTKRNCVLCGGDILSNDVRDQACEDCQKDRNVLDEKICLNCKHRYWEADGYFFEACEKKNYELIKGSDKACDMYEKERE